MQVYISLLTLGTAPLRRLADETNLNRGTTYDALKRLIEVGLVSYVNAKTHRYFTAEDPIKLRGLATRREVAIQEARERIEEKLIPGLQEVLGLAKHRPAVRYYEGEAGVKNILEDVLAEAQRGDGTYRAYSSSAVRDLILNAWPGFTKTRIRKKISCNVIAIGEGGTTSGRDERKWLTKDKGAPTYNFIYGNKTAYVSVDDAKQLFGVIIEDAAITSTQRLIFDSLWNNL